MILLNEFRISVDVEIDDVKMTIANLENELGNCSNKNFLHSLEDKLEKFLSVDELTPQILNALVNKITCSVNGEIRIHYNFENPFETQKEDSNLDG